MFAYGGVYAQAVEYVHHAVRREPEYDCGPVDRPRQARFSDGGFDGGVLERVVEIDGFQPGNVFDERRLVWRDFAEGFEGPNVVLVACLDADVGEVGGVGDNGVEDVAEHGAVDGAALGFGGAVGPCYPENVCDICEGGDFCLGLIGVGDVALDVFNRVVGVPCGALATGDAVHLPGAARGVGDGEDLG